MAELLPYNPTLRDKLRYGIQDTLMSFGVDPYEAGKWGGKIAGGNNVGAGGMGLLDFTPAAIPVDMQEARRAYDQGRYVDAAASGIGAVAGLAPLGGVIAKQGPEFVRATSGALKFPDTFEEMTEPQKLWTYMQGAWADYPKIGIQEKGYLQSAENYNKSTGFENDIANLKSHPYQYGVTDAPDNPFYVPDYDAEFETLDDLINVEDIDWDTGDVLSPVEISGEGIMPSVDDNNAHDIFNQMSNTQKYEFYTGSPYSEAEGGYSPAQINEAISKMPPAELSDYLKNYFQGKDWGGSDIPFELYNVGLGVDPQISKFQSLQGYVQSGDMKTAMDQLTDKQILEIYYQKPYSIIEEELPGDTTMAAEMKEAKEYMTKLAGNSNDIPFLKQQFDTYFSGNAPGGYVFEELPEEWYNAPKPAPKATPKPASAQTTATSVEDQIAQLVASQDNRPMEEQIMELLRAGRGAEVTDEMMRAANQVKLTQMYDLPMDFASRMGRATGMGAPLDESGMPQTLYHAYKARNLPKGEFDEFKNDPYAAPSRYNAAYVAENPRFANSWGQGKGGSDYDYATGQDVPGYAIKPVTLIGGEDFDPYNPAHVARARAEAQRMGTEYDTNDVIDAIVKRDAEWSTVENNENFTRTLEAAGFRSAPVSEDRMNRYLTKTLPERKELYENVSKTSYGQPPSLNRMVFRPQNVRSIYARFDPRLKHLKHLSAGIGGLAVMDALEPDLAEELMTEYLDLLSQQAENDT